MNNTKKLAMEYGLKEMPKYKIIEYEKEFDSILEEALLENEEISSSFYKEKAQKLLNRLKKFKHNHLLFINNFDVEFDNNSEERDLRMIRTKTKIAGCFRNIGGAEVFGDIMSIIKTSIKRGINPFESINYIFNNKVLFS